MEDERGNTGWNGESCVNLAEDYESNELNHKPLEYTHLTLTPTSINQ